jgi:hypothetical protein
MILGIGRASVCRVPGWCIGKGALGFFFLAEEILIFQESCSAESVDQVLFQAADIQIARQPNQMFAQIERAAGAVKVREAFHQYRWNHQCGIGKLKGIADHQSGFIGDWRGLKIQCEPQASQHGNFQIPRIPRSCASTMRTALVP